MPRPRYCVNPDCENLVHPPHHWLIRAGFYLTQADGRVQRYRCRACGRCLSSQTESMHLYAKRRLDLRQINSRIRGGASLRDIGRELKVSRTAIANACLRLSRQAMAAHLLTFTPHRDLGFADIHGQ